MYICNKCGARAYGTHNWGPLGCANKEASVITEREKFEIWVASPPYNRNCHRFDKDDSWPGMYRDYAVQLAWETWQAALSANKPTIKPAEIEAKELRQFFEKKDG